MKEKLHIGDEVELMVYSEICCEVCNEIIHNHIDCPICKTNYAGTEQYHELYSSDTEVTCEVCGSIFEKISEDWYSSCICKIVKC